MSHKDAPPETAEQRRMALFYTARGVSCGWGRDKGGGYLAPYARDAWAAWQEAKRDPRAPDWFPSVTDQPAACPDDPFRVLRGFGEAADQQDVCMSSVHHRFAGIRVVDDSPAVSMQDAPQPPDGTGKQSMQACTRNDAALVQQCEDCEPYDEPHGPHCRSHPDYDGAPKE
jgi:hypothetical protein